MKAAAFLPLKPFIEAPSLQAVLDEYASRKFFVEQSDWYSVVPEEVTIAMQEERSDGTAVWASCWCAVQSGLNDQRSFEQFAVLVVRTPEGDPTSEGPMRIIADAPWDGTR